jgi:uncharacterized protein (UPF0303 family)
MIGDLEQIEKDMKRIAEQERTLQFSAFSPDMAWAIGSHLRADAISRGAGMTFEIQVAGRQLFLCTTEGARPDHLDWIRRKRNTVMRFGRSSYWMSRELELKGKRLPERHEGLTYAEYAMHGGGFPITLKGTGVVGTIVSSGLHQRIDHGMVVDAIAAVLGVEVVRLEG